MGRCSDTDIDPNSVCILIDSHLIWCSGEQTHRSVSKKMIGMLSKLVHS